MTASGKTIEELERERLARQHPWTPLGWAVVLTMIGVWYQVVPLESKLRAVVNAAAFALVEFTFYSVTIQTPEGEVYFRPFSKDRRAGHTTWQQFYANILYTPILMDVYYYILADYWMLRVLLFPINIWLLEIIVGYVLIFLYGYNPAWVYYGKGALFSGNIKLPYAIYWLLFGGVLEIYYPLMCAGIHRLVNLF
jgi:hypothetical protein